MKIAAYVAYQTILPLVRSQVGTHHDVVPLLASNAHAATESDIREHGIDTVLVTSLAMPQWLAFENSVNPTFFSSLTRIVLSRQDPYLLEEPARLLGLDGVVQIDGEEQPTRLIDRIAATASANGNNFDPAPKDPAFVRRLLSLFTISYTDEMDFEIAIRVATGATDREIARDVFLSTKTVRNRISGLLTRSGCRNRTELALMQVHSPYTSWATFLAIQSGEVRAVPSTPPGGPTI